MNPRTLRPLAAAGLLLLSACARPAPYMKLQISGAEFK